MNSFYSESELLQLNLKRVGMDVLISKKCSLYSPNMIRIGDNVRIDDFCILSGNITLGSHIHISAHSAIYGAMGVIMEDYTGLSPRCTIFSAMDDFSGNYLIGPIHPNYKTNVNGGLVVIKRFVKIGAGTIVFPNLIIEEGAVIGAHSLVSKDINEWTINVGIPTRAIKNRSKDLLKFV
ncbi:acyltransferase [uncultured Acetobacteroides sp.]|uniref:acyltransferase n=1 Tax=uncultured Acetobacteroides sp. TaxID=1760811 RepID=UPI0029F54E0D|nr:acyltransferase [uncultured Acetobacteroides sp.]